MPLNVISQMEQPGYVTVVTSMQQVMRNAQSAEEKKKTFV